MAAPSSGLAAPAAFTMTNQEQNAASFLWSAVPGAASYNLYRATVSAAGVVGTFSVIANVTAPTVVYRDTTCSNITTPGYGPEPYLAATVYQYAISTVVGGAESARNYNLQMWAYQAGVDNWTMQTNNLNYGPGVTINTSNTSNLQSGSTHNISVVYTAGGSGFQPISGNPFLTNGPENQWWAEVGMFNYMWVDVYWTYSGQTCAINPISRITTGDNFNSAGIVIGGSSATVFGPAAVANTWSRYKLPFYGPQGQALQMGFGSVTASVSGTSMVVTAVNSAGLNVQGSNYLSGSTLTAGVDGTASQPYVLATNGGNASGNPTTGGTGTYVITPSQGTISSTTLYMQRTNFYKSGFLPSTAVETFYLDNIGFSVA